MKMRDIFEGVTPKSDVALTAYIITVAETYAAAPVNDPKAYSAWEALNRSTTETLMKRLTGSRIKLEYSKVDPYAAFTTQPSMMIRYMLFDMVVNNKLVIYTGDSQHPYFTEEQNVAFRAVHDFFAHGKVRSSFFQQLKDAARDLGLSKLPSIDKAGPLLRRIDLSSYGNRGALFNGRGELNAASSHIRLAPKEAAPALFTEVVGQVSSQIVTGKFGVQKVAILPGFDYQKLGRYLPGSAQERRGQELEQQIRDGAETVRTAFGELGVKDLMARIKTGVA